MSFGKLKTIINDALRQGTSPDKIAASVTLGVVLGVLPIPGLATVMCALVAMVLRLNHAIIQAVNYIAYPLQVFLLGGFIALGNAWFGGSHSTESFSSLAVLMRNDFWSGVMALKQIGLHAVAVWLLTSPLLGLVVYFLSKYAIHRIKAVLDSRRSESMPDPRPLKKDSLAGLPGKKRRDLPRLKQGFS